MGDKEYEAPEITRRSALGSLGASAGGIGLQSSVPGRGPPEEEPADSDDKGGRGPPEEKPGRRGGDDHPDE